MYRQKYRGGRGRGAPQVRISRFRSQHLDRIMQVERASFGRHAYSRAFFRELHAECGKFFFVAWRGRTIAGYVVACLEGAGAEVVSIAVDPLFRGAGVGAALLRAALDAVKARGAAKAALTVRTDNTGAIRFYRAFGFHRVRRIARYYEDGTDAWLMRMLL